MVEIEYFEVPKDNPENKKNKKLQKINYAHKDGFLFISEDNKIKYLEKHKDFNPKGNYIVCRIRKSFKTGVYEAINPIKKLKINISGLINLYDYLWYPIKSSEYCGKENKEDYILNENEIIILGKRIYFCLLIKGQSLINNDDNFNNNISNIIISKSILIIDIETNQYKINDNKSNETVDEVNRQQIKCLNENKNKISYESGRETFSKSENKSSTEIKNLEYESDNKCDLCGETNSDKDNPLICLCNCHNYIHYKCLKEYFKSKIIVSEYSKVTTYRCEEFNCYNCKKRYYSRFRIPEFNKTYELIDFTIPEKTNYIFLESLNDINDKKQLYILHIVKLIDEEITIGSENYNDIVIKDDSISSEHAILKYNKKNGILVLENKGETLGTLVLVRENIKITEEKQLFKIGDTKISMKLKCNKFKKK